MPARAPPLCTLPPSTPPSTVLPSFCPRPFGAAERAAQPRKGSDSRGNGRTYGGSRGLKVRQTTITGSGADPRPRGAHLPYAGMTPTGSMGMISAPQYPTAFAGSAGQGTPRDASKIESFAGFPNIDGGNFGPRPKIPAENPCRKSLLETLSRKTGGENKLSPAFTGKYRS